MDCYPDNRVARFMTKLNGVIELEGDWEVGLTEISFPYDIENVSDTVTTQSTSRIGFSAK